MVGVVHCRPHALDDVVDIGVVAAAGAVAVYRDRLSTSISRANYGSPGRALAGAVDCKEAQGDEPDAVEVAVDVP